MLVDSKYGKGVWDTYFKDKKTHLGSTVKLKIVTDSSYQIQWGDSLNLRTYPLQFPLDGHETWIPRFIDENKNYIVLRQGCGNACWVGYFLPLRDSVKPEMIHEYLGYDLDNSLVAFVKDTSTIEIVNIKTGQTEDHRTDGCTSAFLGYCIDSLSIKNKILKYKWIPDTYLNSQKGTIRIEKIKI
jgi:hypothetical protein